VTRSLLAFALLLAAVGPAGAAPIYRCGNTYSQVPCPEGGSVVEATDPRTGAQRAEARRVAEAERKAAADQERERKEKEKAAQTVPGTLTPAPAPAASAASAPQAKTKTRPKKGNKAATASDKDFVAAVPREKSARK
jgi:hypothetical protein